jgi:hypothetical protein
VSQAAGALHVATGAAHSCAVVSGGTVKCWGANRDGQLGNGLQVDQPTPGEVVGVTLGEEVAAGAGHTCARTADGKVACWGRGGSGQLGNNAPVAAALTPVPVSLDQVATQITAGGDHTCAIAGGKAWCWGSNQRGQLGWEALPDRPIPAEVVNLPAPPAAIAAGGAHTCALGVDGRGWCWGANGDGQLGEEQTAGTDRYAPVEVKGLTQAEEIAAGAAHSCARRSDGSVWCWGANFSAQLGDGIVLQRTTPQLARLACP